MARRFVQIIEDIEESLSRDVRCIVFFETRNRSEDGGVTFKEMFNPFTGELVRKPLEPRFYDDAADSLLSTSPRFTLRLLKLYEDKDTQRGLPPYGNELVEVLPGPQAYQIVIACRDAKTTDGGSDSTVEVNSRLITEVNNTHLLRILTGNNQGTYRIDSVILNGNGPHTITLSNTLLDTLPAFQYNKDAGIIIFDDFIDLSAVKPGDNFIDTNAASFIITAVNPNTPSIAVAPGTALANGSGASITRTGDVLQNDDMDEDQCVQVLDPASPIAGKGTRYRSRSHMIPYTFLYYIKIVSRERDDHIAVADRMLQVFNPPRGSMFVVARTDESYESELIKDVEAGEDTVFVKNASKYYVGDIARICNNTDSGEEVMIKSVNKKSNSVRLATPLSQGYTVDSCTLLVSNHLCCTLERDFTNHVTEDRETEQLWIHRFTYRIEAWVDSRIDKRDGSEEKAYSVDSGDVTFIETVLEDLEGNVIDSVTVPSC